MRACSFYKSICEEPLELLDNDLWIDFCHFSLLATLTIGLLLHLLVEEPIFTQTNVYALTYPEDR